MRIYYMAFMLGVLAGGIVFDASEKLYISTWGFAICLGLWIIIGHLSNIRSNQQSTLARSSAPAHETSSTKARG